MCSRLCAFLFLVSAVGGLSAAAAAESLILANEHVAFTFRRTERACLLSRIARADGSDALDVESDGFEILLFGESRFTAADYELAAPPVRTANGNVQTLQVSLRRRRGVSDKAPGRVSVLYDLAGVPYLRKTVTLHMREGDAVDRLQVLRFSSKRAASRGGHGQPVFLGNWFFGMDYPGFYSRHSDGFKEPDFQYRWHYMIDLEGRDRELAPRKGLVTFFHFPGDATRQDGDHWRIISKRAVIGLSRRPGDGAELGLLDYIAATRKPTRSYLHFNNWYSTEAKAITVESFVNRTYKPMAAQLAKHGVTLDAMVPDHGWENSKTYKWIFEPKVDASHDPLPKVREALEAAGTKLGIWMALDGTNQGFQRGLDIGYRSAYGPDFKRKYRWMQGNKRYFDILQPPYDKDIRRALHFLIAEVKVDYIKHDFNHNFATHGLTQRHARERCLDATLALLAYERELHPGIFQNYTNGAWFSPFWLQQVDCLWMMSGDSGGSGDWPQLSLREGASTYRDRHFFQSFNNPERCSRPVIPIANFMTHGILFSKRKPFTDFKDTLLDWSDYVMMYYGRGTTLKELYLTTELLDDDHWKVLGRASRWATISQDRLMNTVLIGGDPSKGQVYGYVSWVDGRAILTARNPHRAARRLSVPFDASVYHRGKPGAPHRARVIYPFVEPMPWKLISGRAFDVEVPGDSVLVYEIEPGAPRSARAVAPEPLPEGKGEGKGSRFEIVLRVPDEAFQRFDLLIEPWATVSAELTVNGKPAPPDRFQFGKRWTLSAYDLRAHRGKTLTVRGALVAAPDSRLRGDKKVTLDAWIVADRRVTLPPRADDPDLPFAISQNFRRLTQQVLPKTTIVVSRVDKDSELARKLRARATRKRKPAKK